MSTTALVPAETQPESWRDVPYEEINPFYIEARVSVVAEAALEDIGEAYRSPWVRNVARRAAHLGLFGTMEDFGDQGTDVLQAITFTALGDVPVAYRDPWVRNVARAAARIALNDELVEALAAADSRERLETARKRDVAAIDKMKNKET